MNPNDVEEIYKCYPRHVGKRDALRSIERALRRIQSGENPFITKPSYEFAVESLLQAVCAYARSPAGNRGVMTPHPSTWFNQSRYLDDQAEWQMMTKEELDEARRRNEANIGAFRPEQS